MINLPNGHHGKLTRIKIRTRFRTKNAWSLKVFDREKQTVKSFGPYNSPPPAIREAENYLA